MSDQLDRLQAATAVLAAKQRTGVRWADLGKAVDRATEWTTAALLGQHPLTADQAAALGAVLELDADVIAALTLPPVRGRAPKPGCGVSPTTRMRCAPLAQVTTIDSMPTSISQPISPATAGQTMQLSRDPVRDTEIGPQHQTLAATAGLAGRPSAGGAAVTRPSTDPRG
jgi:hypothetical protein